MSENETYAIVESGGKQYRVSAGQEILVEKLEQQEGDTVSLDRVLLVGGEGNTKVGTPLIDGASVEAKVVAQGRGPKVFAFKKKRRKGHTKKIGHRQAQTRLVIEKISA